MMLTMVMKMKMGPGEEDSTLGNGAWMARRKAVRGMSRWEEVPLTMRKECISSCSRRDWPDSRCMMRQVNCSL